MSLQQSDDEAAAVQQPGHPRVTLADIEANVANEYYVNAAVAVISTYEQTCNPALNVLTLCFVVTKAGFTIVGKSAPADPANFDKALGEKLAREDAIRQLWPLMGFALRERLAANG